MASSWLNYAVSVGMPPGHNSPISVAHARVAINNINHYCDEAGQVRVAYCNVGLDPVSYTAGSPVGPFFKIRQFGPFPVTFGDQPYQMRVRLAGRSVGGHSVAFRLVWSDGDGRAEARYDVATPAENALFFSTSSTSTAWLSHDTLLYLPEAVAQRGRKYQNTHSEFGGAPTNAEWCLTYITVWGQTSNAGSAPDLVALYCAEYVGIGVGA